MKKQRIWMLLLAACMAWSCSEEEGPAWKLRVLTFEDSDYAGLTLGYWSSLIDTPQYGGALLYGADGYSATNYAWYDEGNTALSSGLVDGGPFWNGGHAISNYFMADFAGASYTEQLAVSTGSEGAAGHNGSKNFCVHNGYVDENSYSQTLPELEFRNGETHVVDHLWITNTSYVLNALLNGDSYTAAAGPTSWFKVIATGYDAAGAETGSAEFYLYRNGEAVREWTKFELWTLGEVARITFNLEGSDDLYGDWGLNTPAYFAYDDVAVRF